MAISFDVPAVEQAAKAYYADLGNEQLFQQYLQTMRENPYPAKGGRIFIGNKDLPFMNELADFCKEVGDTIFIRDFSQGNHNPPIVRSIVQGVEEHAD